MPGGGDTETLNYKLGYFYDYDLNFSAGYTRLNKGEVRWGEFDQPLNYQIENKVFLRGTVEKSNLYYAGLSYRYNKFISADLYYSHTDIINYNHNLPRYDKNWLDGYDPDNFHPSDYVPGDSETDYTHAEKLRLYYDEYYYGVVEPNKKYQVYSNNTFRLTLNMVFKNYFKNL